MVEHVKGYDPTDDHVLSQAVARYYHKLLAYKDEYEVARLYTNGDFLKSVKAQFQGNYKLSFNLAPPLLPGKDEATGRPKKREFGPWMLRAFAVLARFKFLRGSMFDVFGYTQERKDERALIAEYEYFIDVVEEHIASHNASDESLKLCEELLSIPDDIRGFGPVKEENIKLARTKAALLIKRIQHLSKSDDGGAPDEMKKAA
jgi:indolepyruvate ferredoxin oxidoreductase